MKHKIGFNLIFAILAFPIGLALLRDTDFDSWTFKQPALDTIYLVVFIALLFLMFKKKKSTSNSQ